MNRLAIFVIFSILSAFIIIESHRPVAFAISNSQTFPSVQVELKLWNGNNVSSATVSLWAPAYSPVLRATVTQSATGGTFAFSQTQTGLYPGESFFITGWKIGYQNMTTSISTYDTSQPLIDLGSFTLHGSLQVIAVKAFAPGAGVSLVFASVTDHSTLLDVAGPSLSDGTVESGVDWTAHPRVNVTITKTGWLTNSSLQNIPLQPWTTIVVKVSL